MLTIIQIIPYIIQIIHYTMNEPLLKENFDHRPVCDSLFKKYTEKLSTQYKSYTFISEMF